MASQSDSNNVVLGILIYSLAGGGAERVVSYLLDHYNSLNVETHLILMNEDKKYKLPKGITVHFIAKSNSKESGVQKLLKIPYLAYRYLKLSRKLDLTHSFSFLTRPNYINLIAGFFNHGLTKLIISERAFPSLQYGYGDISSKINRFLISKLYSKADQIICNSNGNKNDLIENFNVPEKKVSVINNPINCRGIEQEEGLKGFFDENYFNIISVGRLDEGKNHKLLINAISNLKNIRLYILGDGILRLELEDLIQSMQLEEKVFLLGFQSNPYSYLKKADLFVFGSNHEGFPNVLLEAMACGLPILSTNCKSGPSEILQYEEKEIQDLMITDYGILVPINDEELMKKGIQYFSLNQDYYLNCKQKVVERVQCYDTTVVLREFEHIIHEK